MNKSIHFVIVFILMLAATINLKAQDSLKFYANVGYITNITKCEDCTQADQGGSVRVGILTKGRFGFYVGYLWFQEYHMDFVGYDDKGNGFLGGVNLRLHKKENFSMYASAGLFVEKFIATYPGGYTDTETNPKPDLGLLFNYGHLNAFLGWQPSEPHHFNIGLGFTL